MQDYTTVSDAAMELSKQLGVEVPPRLISDLLYQRKLDAGRCPVLAGRRLIPRDYLPAVLEALRQHEGLQRPPEEMP